MMRLLAVGNCGGTFRLEMIKDETETLVLKVTPRKLVAPDGV